jgi:hypothetical protein
MNDLLLTIGIISFPGLIAALVSDKLVVHTNPWNSLKYGIYTFVFGVSSYVALQALCSTLLAFDKHLPFLQISAGLSTWEVLSSRQGEASYAEIAWATIISPFVAAIASVIVNYKLINKLAQRFNISRKFGDENLYSYFLNSPNIDWIYVRDFRNNLTYQGLVQSFSETKEMQELVLAEVTVYEYSTSDEFYSVPFLYLCGPHGSYAIEAIPSNLLGAPDGGQEARDQRGHNPGPSEGRGNSPSNNAVNPANSPTSPA